MQEKIETLEAALIEITNLKRWVRDLQAGVTVNCVYCGHRYGPDPGTPVAMADVLKQHVQQCHQHPMTKLKFALEKIKNMSRNSIAMGDDPLPYLAVLGEIQSIAEQALETLTEALPLLKATKLFLAEARRVSAGLNCVYTSDYSISDSDLVAAIETALLHTQKLIGHFQGVQYMEQVGDKIKERKLISPGVCICEPCGYVEGWDKLGDETHEQYHDRKRKV
jgi:hypothetical protein